MKIITLAEKNFKQEDERNADEKSGGKWRFIG
jgi:hypothetical protein